MPHTDFQAEHIPLGYLITFRSHGTWLHGHAGSIDRFHNVFGTPTLLADDRRRQYNQGLLTHPPVILSPSQRAATEEAIRETCKVRNWQLWAVNVRSNHVHTVVTALVKPDRILSALKANATRKMRDSGCWQSDRSPWAYRVSKKYIWTEEQLNRAIAYVEYDQGEPL